MASNDFKVLDSTSTNIQAQGSYAGSSVQTAGFVTGIVASNVFNKILRQGTAMASVLGQFILSALNVNVVDDGTTATIQANLQTAVQAWASPSIRPTLTYVSATQVTVGVGGAGGVYLGSPITKSTAGAWVAGTGNGMGQGLTFTASTWYYVFLIIASTGVADAYLDSSPTGANAPAGVLAKVRIGAVVANGSAQIIPFTQYGRDFFFTTPISILSSSVLGVTTAVATTVLTGCTLAGIIAKVFGFIADSAGAGTLLYVSALIQTDSAPSNVFLTGDTPNTSSGGVFNAAVPVSASGQIRLRVSTTTSNVGLTVSGFTDPFI